MPGPRRSLKVVALIYALAGAILLVNLLVMFRLAAGSSGSAHEAAARTLAAAPVMAAEALLQLVLAGLTFAFRRLSYAWQIVTVAIAMVIALWVSVAAARVLGSSELWVMQGAALAIELGFYGALALVYCLCAYSLWRALRTHAEAAP